ncbi:MAG: pyridoxamine 5'-phosphate oxidase family protein [Candidatus Sericytochromatia bacterium]|nr:pyridoxamine 5'-phosphate oxidase family protein [Candidatus Sericytochromatia bacterium]
MHDMTGDQITEFLAKQSVGHIGMVREGRPYILPVSYVFDQNTIYFATENTPKLADLQQQAETCFEVDEFVPELGRYCSVIGYGHARIIEDADERQRILRALISRFEREAPPMARSRDLPAHTMSQSCPSDDAPEALEIVALSLEELHGREAA